MTTEFLSAEFLMPHSLYLHVPFCAHRCAYCDFNTYAGQEESLPAYVAALCREVNYVAANAPERLDVHTVFFGGGTPSLLGPIQLGLVLDTIRTAFAVAGGAEITLEANPGTVALRDLQAMRGLGVTRISFGVQSANGEELRMLERRHDFLDVLNAFSAARRAGIDNLNADLIYGLPGQSLQTWQTTVRRILDLRPEHISAYALTLERGTPFARWTAAGVMAASSPDLAADMYEWLSLELAAAGYLGYEISNWAQSGRACVHNLQYWRGLPYLGLGAGAHGYANGYRYSNVLRIKTYIDRLTERHGEEPGAQSDLDLPGLDFPFSPAVVQHHRQTVQEDAAEFMMTGLRLTREGIAPAEYQARFGQDLRDQYLKDLEEMMRLGLLEWAALGTSEASATLDGHDVETSEILRLTTRGRLLGNHVFKRFLN